MDPAEEGSGRLVTAMAGEIETRSDWYVHLAVTHAIPMARYPHELRDWWRDEANSRAIYDLSREQEAVLVRACRTRIDEIAASASLSVI